MLKFVKKPEVVSADQWDGCDHPLVTVIPGQKKLGWLVTDVGGCAVERGDWVVKNAAGHYSIVKPHVFAALYEQAQ